MIVMSLFDGMGCGNVALDRGGIKPTQYFASEIDKYAISVAKKNHPETIHLGCVKTVRKMVEAGLFRIDLLIAGSPCQGFSFAGKQLAFDDPRSALFFDFVAILVALKKINPDLKFMLENVKMKKQHLDVITGILGVEPILINSALVSAQNRQRYYWCNWKVEQPTDRGIFLKDIIIDAETDRQKLFCLDASYAKSCSYEYYLKKSRRQMVLCNQLGRLNKKAHEMTNRIYSINGKSPTLMAQPKGGAYPPKISISEEAKLYRKLTPVECERLQTLPDDYTRGVSNTQRYKMLGNGWNADTVAHIFRSMPI